MASVGPRGRRLHKSQILSTVHVVGHKGEKSNLGETNPFCSRFRRKVDLAYLGNFQSWFGERLRPHIDQENARPKQKRQ